MFYRGKSEHFVKLTVGIILVLLCIFFQNTDSGKKNFIGIVEAESGEENQYCIFEPDGSSEWSKEAETKVTLNGGGTGINYINYIWSKSQSAPMTGWNTAGIAGSAVFKQTSFTQDGDWYLYIRTSSSVYRTKAFKIDISKPQPPVISTIDGWTNGESLGVYIEHGTDTVSGVRETHYLLTGASSGSGKIIENGYIEIINEGVTNISAQTFDGAGNGSAVSQISVRIDRTPPVEPQIEITDIDSELLSLSLNGGSDSLSGVNKLQYKLGEADVWRDYDIPVQFKRGSLIVYARTLDNAGNYSNEASVALNFDTESPKITGIIVDKPDGSYGEGKLIPIYITFDEEIYVDGSPKLHLNFGGSAEYTGMYGAETIVFHYIVEKGHNSERLNCIESGFATINEGCIKDNVGNKADSYLMVPDNISMGFIRIDTTSPDPPVIIIEKSVKEAEEYIVDIDSRLDMNSDIHKVLYRLSGAETTGWKEYEGKFAIKTPGSTVIEAKSIDMTGNESEKSEQYITINISINNSAEKSEDNEASQNNHGNNGNAVEPAGSNVSYKQSLKSEDITNNTVRVHIKDIQNHTTAKEIIYLYRKGILKIYSDQTLRPGQKINEKEVFDIIKAMTRHKNDKWNTMQNSFTLNNTLNIDRLLYIISTELNEKFMKRSSPFMPFELNKLNAGSYISLKEYLHLKSKGDLSRAEALSLIYKVMRLLELNEGFVIRDEINN